MEAEQIRLAILPTLEVLLSDCSITEKIVHVFDYLLDDTVLEDEQEEKMYHKAKECLETLLNQGKFIQYSSCHLLCL